MFQYIFGTSLYFLGVARKEKEKKKKRTVRDFNAAFKMLAQGSFWHERKVNVVFDSNMVTWKICEQHYLRIFYGVLKLMGRIVEAMPLLLIGLNPGLCSKDAMPFISIESRALVRIIMIISLVVSLYLTQDIS